MLEVQQEGKRVIIDVRERIQKGEHPRNEILDFVKKAPKGSIFEIHLPFVAQPLINALSSFGINVIVNELEPNHIRLMGVKLSEF